MREIKFRVWYTDEGKFDAAVLDFQTIDNWVYDIKRPYAIYMQYTGLKDKNGVEIYEGDIITVTTNHIADLDPKYPEKTTTVEVRCENAVWWFGDMTMIYTPLKNAKLEVTGNIYENPELLEAK